MSEAQEKGAHLIYQNALRRKRLTVGFWSMASLVGLGGGVPGGNTLPGRVHHSQAWAKTECCLCAPQVLKPLCCPRLWKSVLPLANSEKSLPQHVPTLVKPLTSSEANTSQNQEQLKQKSFRATGELSKINQKSSAPAQRLFSLWEQVY
jgi:hypothetical protein